jgi:hypothetical protein
MIVRRVVTRPVSGSGGGDWSIMKSSPAWVGPVWLEVAHDPVAVVELDQEPPVRPQRPGDLGEHRLVLLVVEVSVRGEPAHDPVEPSGPRQRVPSAVRGRGR